MRPDRVVIGVWGAGGRGHESPALYVETADRDHLAWGC